MGSPLLTPSHVPPPSTLLETPSNVAAYTVPGGRTFIPLYPGLSLGGTSGYNTARTLRILVPLAGFATLVCVVVALNA